MKNINEFFLHFLWKNQHLSGITYYSPREFKIEVLDPGFHNHDAGPDFLNARIRIGDTLWAGNVELHINASDWIRHGHDQDPVYDSVILHVVYYNDCEILRRNDEKIPAAIIRFPVFLWEKYEELQLNEAWIPCQSILYKVPSLLQTQWKTSLIIDRLESKTDYLQRQFIELKSHWDALFLRSIIRSFGVPINTVPFEMLGSLVPYNSLFRYKKSLLSLEAILFGSAGMLEMRTPYDQYSKGLKNEYSRLKREIKTASVPEYLWKYLRMRPSSFPTIRIALLAALIHRKFPVLEPLLEKPEPNDLRKTFIVQSSEYWINHYQFGKESAESIKKTGNKFIDSLIINGIIPFLFLYGQKTKNEDYIDYTLYLLENINAENNLITRNWAECGIEIKNALDSQSLIYLYKSYCKQKRCLDCQFGNNLIMNGHKKE